MVAGKLYLTGGAGSRHKRESFGDPYELPPDRAYCETCAAIASIMWNWRMLLATGQARFAALIERTLYNGFLAGLGLDGTSFFYVNPLQTRSPVQRQPWYQCACCPPNVMRLLASLGHYMATSTGDGVQIHQFASGRLRAGELELELTTGYPYQGELLVRVLAGPGGESDLAIRLPDWAPSAALALNGRDQAVRLGEDRYLHVRRAWTAGDELTVSFPMAARTIRPGPQIDAIRSCVAFERGPLVYCFEAADLGGAGLGGAGLGGAGLGGAGLGGAETSLTGVSVVPGAAAALLPGALAALPGALAGGHEVVALTVPGLVGASREPGWPYRDNPGAPPVTAAELTAIPYYAWANRSPGDMRIWVPER
jgi:hypothetical protein